MRGLVLALLISAAPLAGAAEPILGFNFPVWWHDAYGYPGAVAAFPAMADMGAGWVAIIPSLHTNDNRDSEIVADDSTAGDDYLRLAIRLAHAQGLKVLFKPHVDSRDGEARAMMHPRDPARWFSLYRGHLLRWARLSQEEGVEMFAVGTELMILTTPPHWETWRGLIRETRAVYKGPLTYASNWHSVEHVGFWSELDYIGVDAYYPVPGGADSAALQANMRPWKLALYALSKLSGRPVLFTEIGLAAQKGANRRPWEYHDVAPLDTAVQAAYMDAFVKTYMGEPWVAGFLYWAWEADSKRIGPDDRSMSAQGKPVEKVLRDAFAAGKKLPPPPATWRERLQALPGRLLGLPAPF